MRTTVPMVVFFGGRIGGLRQMTPSVTVCIPTYNGAAYLAACLDSVSAQTFSDVEILVVDDRSSDESTSIANEHAQQDSRIRVVVNEATLGLVGNWNRCVQLSQGEWIKFVFQDDIILPECLTDMLATAARTQMLIVSCARDFIFEPGSSNEDREFYREHRALVEAIYSGSTQQSAQQCSETALRWTGGNFFGEPTALLLRREVFETYGWFNPRLYNICDFEYCIRIASNTGTVHIPEPLALFRVHKSSVSARYKQAPRLRYHVKVLDPLLIVHDFAFHPLYANLRSVARNLRPPVDLAAEFWSRALGALWFARQAADALEHPDASLLEEWRQVVKAYPRLSAIPVKARITAKWRALKKSLSHLAGGPREASR
ncbi:MAG: glycosyltransferase family 2 protein [Candidatus Rokubacteria bacterium]|nr:glycosyltransferase family 2 protein [Candidatus Rokubacteria bacterium]